MTHSKPFEEICSSSLSAFLRALLQTAACKNQCSWNGDSRKIKAQTAIHRKEDLPQKEISLRIRQEAHDVLLRTIRGHQHYHLYLLFESLAADCPEHKNQYPRNGDSGKAKAQTVIQEPSRKTCPRKKSH